MTRNVVTPLAEVVAGLSEGATIAFGTGASSGPPCAFAIEVLRQSRRGLRATSLAVTPVIDMLVAGGALAGLTVPLETASPASTALLSAVCEAGGFELNDVPLRWLSAGVKAAALKDDALRMEAECGPVPTISPDVTVLHAHAADPAGNVLLRTGRRFPVDMDLELAMGARKLIVCVEQVVSARTTRAECRDLVLEAERVDHVVEVPFGSWPAACAGRYAADNNALEELAAAGPDAVFPGRFAGKDHAAMLSSLGSLRLWGGTARRAW